MPVRIDGFSLAFPDKFLTVSANHGLYSTARTPSMSLVCFCFTHAVVPPVVSLVTSHAGKEAVGLGVSEKHGHIDVYNGEKGWYIVY